MKSPPNHRTSSLESSPSRPQVYFVGMLDLPVDLQRRIASFLPPVDALNMSRTCRIVRSTTCQPHSFVAPSFGRSVTHSVILSLNAVLLFFCFCFFLFAFGCSCTTRSA